MPRPQIMIADDHAFVAEACKKMLEPEFDVVATVGDGRALVRIAATLQPQVIIIDIRMPLLNGLDAGRQIKQILGSVKLVFLTMKYGPRFGRRGIPTRSFRLPSENLRGIGTGGGDSGGFEGQVVSLSGNHQGNSRLLAAPGRGIY